MARRSWDPVPVLVLAVILLAGLAAWWAFPRVQRALSSQDCVASGHVNCGQ
jgi:hypothetical protein